MIRIEPEPWNAMTRHAMAVYPDECCGAMLGTRQAGETVVFKALAFDNVHEGDRASRFEIRPSDLLGAQVAAGELGFRLVGVYHSHPNGDPVLSREDLQGACPWLSFLILAVRDGAVRAATSWRTDPSQIQALREELEAPAARADTF